MAVFKADKPTKDGRQWIFFERYTDLSGEVKQYKSKKFRTEREAKEAERLFHLELDKYVSGTNMTFKELYMAYYEYQRDKVKETTMLTYTDRMRYMELLDNVKVSDFNIRYYEQWRKKMLTYEHLSNRTRNYVYKFLKAIMNYGTKFYNLNFSHIYPKMTNFTDPNEVKKEMLFWTFEEYQQFIDVEEDLLFKTFFKTLYYCGFRHGEIRALDWHDIDLINNTITVRYGVADHINGKKFIRTSPKTKSSNRTLPLLEEIADDLRKLKKQAESFKNFKKEWFVFGNEFPITDGRVRDRKNKNCELAGVKQIRIHDFRHSCASLLINSNADITLVSKYLGHAKIEETLNTYSHMFKNKLDDVMAIIRDLNSRSKGITKEDDTILNLKEIIANQSIEIRELKTTILTLEKEVEHWKNEYNLLASFKSNKIVRNKEIELER